VGGLKNGGGDFDPGWGGGGTFGPKARLTNHLLRKGGGVFRGELRICLEGSLVEAQNGSAPKFQHVPWPLGGGGPGGENKREGVTGRLRRKYTIHKID